MLTINKQRLLDDIESLARIGATPEGGVSRPAMSDADAQGRAWFRRRVEDAGLEFRQDGAGNLSAVLSSADPMAPTVLFGSHLDTVPNGGRYDGALGVLSALEALRTVRDASLALPAHLEAISFTDEEGSLLGLFGSRALCEHLSEQDFAYARGGKSALAEGMERLGITTSTVLSARRYPTDITAFVELHIEQGTRLEDAGVDIGAVTAIVGIRSYMLRFIGTAAHAGTMPMDRRADALWGASAFVQQAQMLVRDTFTPGVMNCGLIEALPGAFNIVPGEVRLALEFRHGTLERLNHMEDALLDLAERIAAEFHLRLDREMAGRDAPALMDERVVQTIEDAATALNLRHTRLMSFAGHDSQEISMIVPSAMIFVPSVQGISHNPREFTHVQDVVNGAATLLQTVLRLASAGNGESGD
jgi:N-carbamoyl-L-amino-acid hydrolase